MHPSLVASPQIGQDDDPKGRGGAPLLQEVATVAALAPAAGWRPGERLDADAAAGLLSAARGGAATSAGEKDDL